MGPVNEKLHEKEMRQELRLTKERHVEKFNKLLLKKKLTVLRIVMIAVIEIKMVSLIQRTQQQPSNIRHKSPAYEGCYCRIGFCIRYN